MSSPSIQASESDSVPSMAPGKEKSSCNNSCCGGDVKSIRNETQAEFSERKLHLPSSDHCTDGQPKDEDAPDCCRGKDSPCCDTSCLDRLAMRGYAMKADPEATVMPNTSGAASDSSACHEPALSALDRYGATLKALGCICRSLIALGEETCCESRKRTSLVGNREHGARSATSSRASLDSVQSNRSLAKSQIAKSSASLQKAPGESFKSRKACLDDTSSVSDYSKGKFEANVSMRSELSKKRFGTVSVGKISQQSDCSNSCCASKDPVQGAQLEEYPSSCSEKNLKADSSNKAASNRVENFAKHSESPSRNVENCCSETARVEQSALEFACSDSHYLGDHLDEDSNSKDKSQESCGSKVSPAIDSLAVTCAGPCCETSKITSIKETPVSSLPDTCCKSSEKDIVQSQDSCCSGARPVSPKVSCADACCSSDAPGTAMEVKNVPLYDGTDIENQGRGKEYVVLNISGMTCTGCETKLQRTLASVPAVEDLKTSLVLSRVEFNLNLSLGSVEQVMKHLERTTEFKCERLRSDGSSLDLVVPGGPSNIIEQKWPHGVLDMTLVDEKTVRVVFDPKIIGARDLTEKAWGPLVELAALRGDPSLEAGSKHVRHIGIMTLLSAVLTIPVLTMAWAPLPKREVAYSSASLALATIVQVAIAGPFYPKALKALFFSRVVEMDLLIVLSTSTAYVFSVVSFGYLIAGTPLSTGQFFETSTLLVTLIMVGRWVAALARQRAVESVSIQSLQSSTAIIIDEDGREHEIDIRLLQYGDIFKVLPDTNIPTDGTVMSGSSEIDESMLTGESQPVEKHPDSTVIAGSINGPGVITVRLDRLPSENTIKTIAAMVDEAKLSKPKLQDLADRVAAYFVPVVVALTLITFVIWVAVGKTIRGYDGSETVIQAITYAITVLIVSCPCAIGLAVPMVIVISSGVAAEKGIIFKSADAIESAHKTGHVVFDKTGTLTRGKLSVVAQYCINGDKLPLLLGLIENSRHPVSVSVANHLRDTGVVSTAISGSKSLTGKGIEAILGGQVLRAGNSRWLGVSEHETVLSMLSSGYTVFCFTIESNLLAVFGLEDELRSDAAATIESLKMRGVSVHVVSGDDHGAVQALATKLNIPEGNVRSRSSPADKSEYISKLLDDGPSRKKPVVVFCGDGTNDAVALARATIGVHINEGTDVAKSAADVVLMRPSLDSILTMMNTSRKAVNRIKFNFAWSFVYNLFAILLSAGAFVNARIPPEYAGLGELVSVLPVIAAAVLLRWSKI